MNAIDVRTARAADPLERTCSGCGGPAAWVITFGVGRTRFNACAACVRELGRQIQGGLAVLDPLTDDDRRILRGILLDTAEVLDDIEEEAHRVVLARRVAAALED
jgi:hypothetical protein